MNLVRTRSTPTTRPAGRVRAAVVTAAFVAVASSMAGCSSESATATSPDDESASTSSAELTMVDPWVKAADTGMTAAFGTLVNDGDADVTVVSATSDVTPDMELHETVAGGDGAMAMQPKTGGFVVPAGESHVLEPGGDHLMIMDLTRPVVPGEDVTITLDLDDDTTMDVVATAKEFSGADEEYQAEPRG